MAEPQKYELILKQADGPKLAKVIHIDPVNDIALLKVEVKFAKVLTMSGNQAMAVGESLFSLGFPKAEEITVIPGIFNGERQMGFAPVITASMPMNPGMSGGPCFNTHGEVVGVNRAMVTQAQNISYLSPGSALNRLVAKARDLEAGHSAAGSDWKKNIFQDIVAQEKWAMSAPVGTQGVQAIGKVSFALPMATMQCGQDDLNRVGQAKMEILVCRTVSLALLSHEIESLQLTTVAMRRESNLSLTSAFDSLKANYEKLKARQIPSLGQSRQVAAIGKAASVQRTEEKCGARSVRNQHGVNMHVRFCSLNIPEIQGLYSTFVKVDLTDAGQNMTSFAQSYEGLSLPTTRKMVQDFIESIALGH